MPPHYRWFDNEAKHIKDDPVAKFRAIPPGLSPEDAIRMLAGEPSQSHAKYVQPTVDRLFQLLEDDPEIEVRTPVSPTEFVSSFLQ
jgi:hypothetical protein